jgi:hypothetical protein
MNSAHWIPACELRDTDVLEFDANVLSPQGVTHVDGLPIDKLTRHPDGRVEVDLTYADGIHRYKTFAPDERVMVHDRVITVWDDREMKPTDGD